MTLQLLGGHDPTGAEWERLFVDAELVDLLALRRILNRVIATKASVAKAWQDSLAQAAPSAEERGE